MPKPQAHQALLAQPAQQALQVQPVPQVLTVPTDQPALLVLLALQV